MWTNGTFTLILIKCSWSFILFYAKTLSEILINFGGNL